MNMKEHLHRTADTGEGCGNILAILSFILWGSLVFYWKVLDEVPALIIVSHRILWCFVFMLLYILLRGRFGRLTAVLKVRRHILILLLSGILVGANWFIYVLSVSRGQVLQASLGYYINPLMNVFLGLLFLKERLTPLQWISLTTAFIGVVIMTVGTGVFPWISLTLAVTFSLYGLIKKTVHIPSDLGLTLETTFLTPVALLLLYFLRRKYGPMLGNLPPLETVLLPASGIVTALPLFLFSEGAKRIPLSRIGFFQFISPSLMFLIGYLVYGEPLTTVKVVSFIFIWTALILFLLPRRRVSKKKKVLA
ncbi:MAG: EamA family transporter RarD [Spirochaetales bacterium]|nr:EamA family transporter RarD [Spirochaetales bacterium]